MKFLGKGSESDFHACSLHLCQAFAGTGWLRFGILVNGIHGLWRLYVLAAYAGCGGAVSLKKEAGVVCC